MVACAHHSGVADQPHLPFDGRSAGCSKLLTISSAKPWDNYNYTEFTFVSFWRIVSVVC